LYLTATVVLVPALILAASAWVLKLDDQAGFQKYSVPMLFFGIYLAAFPLSPITGIAALLLLRNLRKREPDQMQQTSARRLRWCVVVTSILALVSDAAWFYGVGFVFFAMGGTR
jgi:hypothetical protein